jgi:hypothetical protein
MKKAEILDSILNILSKYELNNYSEIEAEFRDIFQSSNRMIEYKEKLENERFCKKFKIYLSNDNFSESSKNREDREKKNIASIEANEIIKKFRIAQKNLKDEIEINLNLFISSEIEADKFKEIKNDLENKISKLEIEKKRDYDFNIDYDNLINEIIS